MSNDKVRESFEAWALTHFINSDSMIPLERDQEVPEGYRFSRVDMAWIAWQASRAAVVVELPAFEGYKDFVVRELQGAFTQASEAAGLKVKP